MSSNILEINVDDPAVPSGRTDAAPVPPTARRLWPALTWVGVISLSVAAVVLSVSALRTDSPSINLDNVRTIAEHGSISAIDHRDELVLSVSHTPAQTIAEHGSISAIDHRDELVLRAGDTPAQTIAEHGSVSAIDHSDSVGGEP